MNGENISWLTGKRAGAKGSASFSWISYWKLVSFSQPVLADTESVRAFVSSLGAQGQRRGAWRISSWLLPHNPAVHLQEQGGDGLHLQRVGTTLTAGQQASNPRHLPGEAACSWWAAQTLPTALRHAQGCQHFFPEIRLPGVIRILSQTSHSLQWDCLRAESSFLYIINITSLKINFIYPTL